MTIGRSGAARRHGAGTLAALAILLAVFAASIGGANAQSGIDHVLQPRGRPIPGLLPTVPSITTGFDANQVPGMNAPPTQSWANPQPAGVVRTTEPTEYYVRFYAPPHSVANRAFIMRASTARGLTPEQIRDRFALPFLPTHVTNVLVPAGTCLLTGIAAPILGHFTTPQPPGPWGHGGAQQTFIVGVDRSNNCTSTSFLPEEDYINRRRIGGHALWYAPIVGGGNPGAVAAYLDHLPAPTEYSNFYDVYNTLDILNDGSPINLRPALAEITGQIQAAAIAIVAADTDRIARIFADHARSSLDHAQIAAPLSTVTMYGTAGSGDPPPEGWWAAGGGQFGRVDGNSDQAGYHFDTGRGIIGYDHRASSDLLVGGALAFEQTNFDVSGPSNSGAITTLHGGAYGAAELGWFKLATSALASWDQFDTTRTMPTFARSATATYDAWSTALSTDASRIIPIGGGVLVEPLAGVSFVEVWRPGFSESGASSLSLVALNETQTVLASRLGASLTRPAPLDNGMVLFPWARAFWAHDFFNTEGGLTAAFAGATGPSTFSILSAGPARDAALLGAGLTLDLTDQSSITVAYDGEWGSHASVNTIWAGGVLRW